MTVKLTRPVTRETNDKDPCRGQTIMIRLEADGHLVRVWTKGSRTKYTLRYADVWRLGFQKAVLEARLERAKERARRRAERQQA